MRAKLSVASLLGFLLTTTPAWASVEISSKPTVNITCSGGTCTPLAKSAVLNVNDLIGMLASGDTTIKSSSLARNIQIDAAIPWASASRLNLDAYHSIRFNKAVEIAGLGALTITTNDGGTGGDYRFSGKGHVRFWDSKGRLTINSVAYSLVKTVHELSKNVEANPAGNYALANSYDASMDNAYRPITGNLSGKFEGLGNVIENITIQPKKNVGGGLFVSTDARGVIRDLNVVGLSISPNTEFNPVGGLVGVNEGTVEFVSISGKMFIEKMYDATAGLIVGSNGGTILESLATGSINASGGANTYVGGLAGGGGNIVNSHASVDIQKAFSAGGLVGFGDTINNCYATGNVSGDTAGGLVGRLRGSIDGSFATGSVNGCCDVGGLVGISDSTEPHTYVVNSYSTGSVTNNGAGSAGGLIGSKYGDLQQVYSVGPVIGSQVGGLIGYDYTNDGTNSSAYWDRDTSGVKSLHQGAGNAPNDPGVVGLRDAALMSSLPSGFDPTVWSQNPNLNKGYPYLISNPPPLEHPGRSSVPKLM